MKKVRIEAVLDGYTCDVCLAWHGKEMTKGEAAMAVPLAQCENPNGCRCALVHVPPRGNGEKVKR